MVDTPPACLPPEHLRGVDGWHWLNQFDGNPVMAEFVSGIWIEVWMPSDPVNAYKHGYRYVSPVASPAEVDALRARVAELEAGMMRLLQSENNCQPLDGKPCSDKCGCAGEMKIWCDEGHTP